MKHSGSFLAVAMILTAMVFTPFGGLAQDEGTTPPARGGFSRGFGGGGFRGFPGFGRGAPAPLPAPSDAEMLPARFQAAVYEVEVSTNPPAVLDAKKLEAQASTTETLLKALGEAGKSRLLYRVDQPVNVFSDRIQMGSQVPNASPNLSNAGRTISTITYQNLGMSVLLSAQTLPKGARATGTNVAIELQFSTMVPSDVESGLGQRAPVIRSQMLRHSEPLEFGKPRVLLNVGPASSSGDQVPQMAYVVRYVFSPVDSK